jgi:hypothetical protein
MTRDELNFRFQEEARYREEKSMKKCDHRRGRYQAMADELGALPAAIKLIRRKEPSDGLTRLFLCEEKVKKARELSLEKIYIEFSEMYGNEFPDWFPNEIVETAKKN